MNECEGPIERFHVLRSALGVQVALGSAQTRMSEERLEEVRARLACDQRSSRMPMCMEPQRPQSRRVSGARVATAHGGTVEPAAEPRAEHIIVATRVVAAVGQTRERGRRHISERQRSRLPALGRSLDARAYGAVHDHETTLEVDILPTQRKQLAETHAGVRRDAIELCVLTILLGSPCRLVDVELGRLRATVGARAGSTRQRLDLLAALPCARHRIVLERVGVLALRVGEHRAK